MDNTRFNDPLEDKYKTDLQKTGRCKIYYNLTSEPLPMKVIEAFGKAYRYCSDLGLNEDEWDYFANDWALTVIVKSATIEV